jgi:hypothetical protein
MRVVLFACAIQLLTPVTSWADWHLKPFLGVTFGGETTFIAVERAAGGRKLSFGVNTVWLGNIVGVEADLAHGPGFFQEDNDEFVLGSSVTTLTGSVVLTLPREMTRYTLRPYVVGGAGLMRVRIDHFFDTFNLTDTFPAMNVGGGATGFLSDRVGLSWDVRYFQTLGGSEDRGFSIGKERLSFWRAMMAVAIRLQRDYP